MSWLLFDGPALAVSAGIVLLSFVSEDTATLSSALLVLGGPVAWPVGFLSCFAGIWAGDLGLYAVARCLGRSILQSRWVTRVADAKAIERVERKFVRRGMITLLACRFIPGTRLPAYLAAGLCAMPLARFATITGLAALVWISVIFALTKLLGAQTLVWLGFLQSKAAAALLVIAVIAAALCLTRWLARRSATWPGVVRRWAHWEFWPAWLFYLPVGAYYLWLSMRHRSFSLPSAANPGIPTGGLIGESKCAIIDQLYRAHPEFVADAYRVAGVTVTERLLALDQICREHALRLPFILKPDIGQRGNGVKLIRSMRSALHYLEQVQAPVIVQRYAPGPNELGVFYYRFPGEARGRIFALTEKIFPAIAGDGRRTIAQLIAADLRAALIAKIYLRRFADCREEILPNDQTLQLVETGNHAQGCIFRDGAHFLTRELENAIDRISSLPGFFIGRYDIRFASEDALRRGENFQIVELNGASAEATNIYDARNSLRSAYRTLFEQWRLVFAIGAANRARGHTFSSLVTLWREWRKYSVAALSYPAAD